MLANREGLFHAYPVDIGLGETRQAKLLQVNILYRLFEELVSGEWTDCSGEGLEITGFHVLEKKDNALNTSVIESLKAALGWDGRDPFWLQDNAAALCQVPVQLKLVFEEYDGQRNIKVAFLNPYGSQRGGVPKADDGMRRSVGNRLGGKFRAYAGGTPANPPMPAGKPAAPASAPLQKPSAPKPAPVPTATMEEAWGEFTQKCPPPKWDQESTEKEWFRILGELFPGKQPEQLTPADWGVMRAEGPGRILPF